VPAEPLLAVRGLSKTYSPRLWWRDGAWRRSHSRDQLHAQHRTNSDRGESVRRWQEHADTVPGGPAWKSRPTAKSASGAGRLKPSSSFSSRSPV
jgi:hypothetical protein